MSERASKILLAAFLVALFAYNAGKFAGYLPIVFPDEDTYITATLCQPLSESVIPNYLYYGILSIAGRFGDHYLDAARILNGFFYVLAGPFLFMIARMGCGPGLSLLITATSLLLPYSWYTAFFMPESLSFTCFWVWSWFLLRYRRLAPLPYGLLAGAGIGLASLVKVHWVFLLPCFAIFILLSEPAGWRSKSGWVRILAALPAFLVAKFGISLLLAGTKGLTLFGHDYAVLAETGMQNATVFSMALLTLTSLAGHIPVLLFFFGFVFVLMITSFPATAREDDGAAGATRDLTALLFASLPILLLITAGFTASVSLYILDSAGNEAKVVQTRYYSFLYPAFIILSGYFLNRYEAVRAPRAGKWLFGGLAILAVLAFLTRMWGYSFFRPLCPEIAIPFHDWPSIASLVLTAGAVTPCLLAMKNLRTGLQAFSYFFAPFLAVYFTVGLVASYHRYLVAYDPMVATGRYLQEVLGEGTNRLAILDTTEYQGTKIRFFADNRAIPLFKRLTPGREIDPERLAPGMEWALVVGNIAVPAHRQKFVVQPVPPHFYHKLVRIADFSYSVDVGQAKPSWPISEVRVENGGVTVVYSVPLPEVMRIRLQVPEEREKVRYSLEVDGLPRAVELDASTARTVTVRSPGKTIRVRPIGPGAHDNAALPDKILITVRSDLPAYAAWEERPVTLPIDYVPTMPRCGGTLAGGPKP